MHYFGELELAVRGKAETLQNIPFEEITEAALEARQKAWNYPGDVEHNLEEFLHKMKSEVKRVLQDPSEDGIEVFYLQTEFDGAPIEMDCLELLMRRYPELEAAVIANVEFDTADPSGTEWFTFYSPAGSEQLSGSLPFNGFGEPVRPSHLSVRALDGTVYAFSLQGLAELLAQSDPEYGQDHDEEVIEDYKIELSYSPDFPGISLNLIRTPDGQWGIVEDDLEDLEDCEAVEVDGQVYYCGSDGSDYFCGWDWNWSAVQDDWGFPPEADWIPFDLENNDFSSDKE